MKKGIVSALLAIALLCPAGLALAEPAQEASKPAAVQDKPAPVASRVISVSVELEGTDSIGARLGMRLKEAFNASNLFRLTEEDTPKMRLIVTTAPEFSSRPSVGSVYSLCWTFSQKKNYLSMLLGREVGTVSVDEVDALVARVVERTDGLGVKYADLFRPAK